MVVYISEQDPLDNEREQMFIRLLFFMEKISSRGAGKQIFHYVCFTLQGQIFKNSI